MNRNFNLFLSNLKKKSGYLILLLSFVSTVNGQVRNISGVLNSVYSSIDSVYSKNMGDPDTLILKSVEGFAAGDTVCVIQSAGARVDRNYSLKGYIADIRNTGRYAIFIVKNVVPGRNMVVLNTSLLNYTSIVKGELGQLIKIPTFKRVNVSGTLTCDPYNPITGEGGVLIMLVEQSLTLNANIDVSGKGFPGADPGSDEYGGPCADLNAAYRDSTFFFTGSTDSAALKGYGLYDTTFSTRRGRNFATNAGGGGNNLYSGGGGGGHYGVGGSGGDETNVCSNPRATGGLGGKDLTTFYPPSGSRLFMGGGGGTGTQKPSIGRTATVGGAGGGIVIILSDTIIGNGNRIMSQGQSVGGLALAGAGGGGAGGAVVLHAYKYATTSTLFLDVRGGNGGDVSTVPGNQCGPGGGGGAGLIWFNNSTITGNVTYICSGGLAGKYGTLNVGAGNGGISIPKNNLIIQIRGFLFNKLPDDQTICQDETPLPINAPPAAGGDGSYTYLWEQSADMTIWAGATGTRTNPGYIPGVLTDTTYYRRIVDDGIIPRDTSKILAINVHPRLNNNSISPDTTICSGLTANSLYSTVVISGALGEGSYNYAWEKSSDNASWSAASGTPSTFSYATPVLTDTTYFRRRVESGACESISNSVKISVLDPLSGNNISSDQIICYNQSFAPLNAGSISGGEPLDREYQWQQRYSATWDDTVTTENFTPLVLSDSVRYRRIVRSGLNNTCISISNELMITVLPKITNNSILNAADSVFCAGIILDSLKLNGSNPNGGNKPDFTYIWQIRLTSQAGWTNAESVSILKTFNAGVLNDTTYFRRILFSGANDVCKDTSLSILMKVLPELENNTISAPQVICALEIPTGLTGSVTTGGNNLIPTYKWQINPTPANPATWTSATGINSGKDYAPPSLSSTLHYRRIVLSGPTAGTCKDTSAILAITVHNDISNNIINNTSPVYTCYNIVPQLLTATTKISGGLAGGDETNYTYSWIESINNTVWTPSSQPGTGAGYQAEALTFPKYYRRIVESGACDDTSSMVKIDTTHIPVLVSLSAQSTPVCFFPADPYSQVNMGINEGYAPYIINYSDGNMGTGIDTFDTRNGMFRALISNPSDDSTMYTYRIENITDKNGCIAGSANLLAFNAPVKVYATPTPSFTANSFEVCDSLLTISPIASFGTPQWEYVSGLSRNMYTPSVLNGTNIDLKANFTANGDFDSEAHLVYREYKANCNSSDSFHAIFYKNPESIGNLYRISPTEEVPFGDTLVVFVSDNQNIKSDSVILGTLQWKMVEGPASFTSTDNRITKLKGLELDFPSTIEFSINNGVCSPNKKQVKVIRKDFIIYDGFSPNDDGINDVLYAKGLYDEEIKFKFQIFSGQGSFIREITRKDVEEYDFIKNELVLWDGSLKMGGAAEKIPDGTYYYVLSVNYKNQNFDKKGYIIINR